MDIAIHDDFLRMIIGIGPGAPLAESVKNYLHGYPDTEYRKAILGQWLLKHLEQQLIDEQMNSVS